ncbi:hypothetical protein ES703_123786 [subsurface metagenome]
MHSNSNEVLLMECRTCGNPIAKLDKEGLKNGGAFIYPIYDCYVSFHSRLCLLADLV